MNTASYMPSDNMNSFAMMQPNVQVLPNVSESNIDALNAEFQAQMNEISKYCMCDLYQL